MQKTDKKSKSPNFFDWRKIYPELQILYDNVNVLLTESENLPQWTPWPENHYAVGSADCWTVFPLLHTFPAYDESKITWLDSTCQYCPQTVEMLKSIPNIRTALFSRLIPGTQLSAHTGWADLANHVLRCHVCIKIPTNGECGMIVNKETSLHRQGEILVFDDSKIHEAFNLSSDQERVVLIVDLLRPSTIPLGTAKGGHTKELDSFVSQFK